MGVATKEEQEERDFVHEIDQISSRATSRRYLAAFAAVTGCCCLGMAGWAAGVTVALTQRFHSDDDDGDVWAPLPTTRPHRIAFGSCAEQTFPQPYWDTLSRSDVDLLILGGDNVYGDCSTDGCPELAQAYADLAAKPSFIAAKSLLPMVVVWDDHDYGKNDAYADNNPYKELAKSLFLDFWAVDDERAESGRGLYTSYEFGDLQLVLLDARWSRSQFAPTDEHNAPYKERYLPSDDGTMLGDDQWAWLDATLAKPARVRVVVSSIQVVADGHGWECWRMLPLERQRLYDKLEAASGTSFLVSGDRHVGGLYKYTSNTTDWTVYEATGSSWTHTSPQGWADCGDGTSTCDEPGPLRLGPLVHDNNFVTMDFDWDAATLMVALRKAATSQGVGFNDDSGNIVQNVTIEF